MGTLYLVATPIGNLEDISIRAIKTLFSVDYLACEDTRRTGQLLKNYESRIKDQELRIKDFNINKSPKLISYYDEIELKRIPEIIELLTEGKNLALVSDSGTPLICDPGFKLARECIRRGIRIVSIPGPASPVSALTLSGFPTNQFLFLGFLPSSSSKRKKILRKLSSSRGDEILHPTIILFESPYRLKETFSDMKEVFGDIEVVIARELTKIHEEVWRGKISDALNHFQKPLGEFIILFTFGQ